jgi:hypothetical protein
MRASVNTSAAPLSERIAKRLSPYALAIAMLLFLIPFVSVSCATPAGYGSMGGGVTAKYNGLDLAMGGLPTLEVAENAKDPGPPTAEDGIPMQPLFTLTLLFVAAAFVAAVRAREQRAIAVLGLAGAAIASGVAGFAEFDRWLTDRIVAALVRQANPRLASTDPATYVNADLGFALLMLLLTLTLALNGVAFLRRRPAAASPQRSKVMFPRV